MVLGGQGAGGAGLVGGFVVPDGSGEGEKPLAHAGPDTVGFSCTVAFKVELGFEGLVDRYRRTDRERR